MFTWLLRGPSPPEKLLFLVDLGVSPSTPAMVAPSERRLTLFIAVAIHRDHRRLLRLVLALATSQQATDLQGTFSPS